MLNEFDMVINFSKCVYHAQVDFYEIPCLLIKYLIVWKMSNWYKSCRHRTENPLILPAFAFSCFSRRYVCRAVSIGEVQMNPIVKIGT
jgi:hypothetical protein